MNIKQRQISQTTYQNNSVGRVFRKGSFWDRAFKAASKLVLLIPIIGTELSAAMIAVDNLTPEKPELPGGGTSSGGGRSPLLGEGSIKIQPREFFAGIPKQNKNYNPPKVF